VNAAFAPLTRDQYERELAVSHDPPSGSDDTIRSDPQWSLR
jgi:hypothetical protein